MKNGNNKKNYMVLNGVEIELSDQLVQQLQDGIKDREVEKIEVEKKVNKVENLFKRVDTNSKYGIICPDGILDDVYEIEYQADIDDRLFNNINYFTKIENTNLHMLLADYFHKKNLMQRKMIKFSLLHDGYKINWGNDATVKHTICYYVENNYANNSRMSIESCRGMYEFDKVYFHTKEIAQQFINENKNELLELFNLEKDLFKSIENYCEN